MKTRAWLSGLLAAVLVLGLAACAAPQPEVQLELRGERAQVQDAHRFWAEQHVAGLSLEQKAQSVLMLHWPGTDRAALQRYVQQYQPGGMILMGDNIPGDRTRLAAVVSALQDFPRAPRLVAIDQEGGVVARVPDPGPGARALRAQPPSASADAARKRAALLAGYGITVNFGTVADLTADRRSFIYSRVLGTTPGSSADRVSAVIAGESGGVLSTLKHFPGHGAAPGDSHFSLPSTGKSKAKWLAEDAVPFIAGIEAGAPMVMTGHLVYRSVDGIPASLSPKWHRILREELGFDGIVVTDDLLMLQRSGVARYRDGVRNGVDALDAGATLLLYVLGASAATSNGVTPERLIEGIVDAVQAGTLDAATLDDAAVRLFAQRRALSPLAEGRR